MFSGTAMSHIPSCRSQNNLGFGARTAKVTVSMLASWLAFRGGKWQRTFISDKFRLPSEEKTIQIVRPTICSVGGTCTVAELDGMQM